MRGMPRGYRVAWAIPSWNGARLGETLASLPSGEPREVVWTKKLGWSVAHAWNWAIEKYLIHGPEGEDPYEVLIIANDDIVVREDTGQLLAQGLLEGQFDAATPAQGDHPARTRELLLVTGYNLREGHPDIGCRWAIGPADFSLFAITRKFWDVVGSFDEAFAPAYFEDNDAHERIRLAGYEAGSWAPYVHHGGTTVATDPERRSFIQGQDRAFERCRAYFRRKWGWDPCDPRPDDTHYSVPFDPSSARREVPA